MERRKTLLILFDTMLIGDSDLSMIKFCKVTSDSSKGGLKSEKRSGFVKLPKMNPGIEKNNILTFFAFTGSKNRF